MLLSGPEVKSACSCRPHIQPQGHAQTGWGQGGSPITATQPGAANNLPHCHLQRLLTLSFHQDDSHSNAKAQSAQISLLQNSTSW